MSGKNMQDVKTGGKDKVFNADCARKLCAPFK